MKIFQRAPFLLPLVLATIGAILAVFTLKPVAAATFITSAQPEDIRIAMDQAMTEDQLAAIIEKRKLKLNAKQMRQLVEITPVKTDEIRVTFDYNEDAGAARAAVVDLIHNVGATGKAPIVALELARKKPQPSTARIGFGAVSGFALGYALRKFVFARWLPGV